MMCMYLCVRVCCSHYHALGICFETTQLNYHQHSHRSNYMDFSLPPKLPMLRTTNMQLHCTDLFGMGQNVQLCALSYRIYLNQVLWL